MTAPAGQKRLAPATRFSERELSLKIRPNLLTSQAQKDIYFRSVHTLIRVNTLTSWSLIKISFLFFFGI